MKSTNSQQEKQPQSSTPKAIQSRPPLTMEQRSPQDSDPYTQKLRAAVIKAGTAMREYNKLHPLKIHPIK